MNDNDFNVSILVDQTPRAAFNAAKNFKAWWSEQIEGETDQLNNVFVYHYKDIHLCRLKLVEMVTDKKLVYEVLDNHFSFTKDKTEWIGSRLVFEMTEQEGKTRLQFTHEGLRPEHECFQVCNDAWTGYIKNSLYQLITTGKGNPNPADGEGFNAQIAEKWKLNQAFNAE